jgi:Photosynthesis system II assembly factor YCF48/Putative zinc-finger
MQDVPKIVRVRLPQAAPGTVGTHPDADLLTAFAEQSLSKSEQERVMEHLARCGDCREVVALALPAMEAQHEPVPVHRSGRWLSWPVLRWGVVAAGTVLVTSVGVLEYKQHTEQKVALVSTPTRGEEKITASQAENPLPATNAPAPHQARERTSDSATPELARSQSRQAADRPSTSANALFPAPQPMDRGATGGGIGGGVFRQAPRGGSLGSVPASAEAAPVAAQSPAAPNATAVIAQQAALPPSSQMVEVQSETAQTSRLDQIHEEAIHGRMALPSPEAQRNLDVVKAKDSEPQQQAQSNGVFAPAASSSNLSLQKALRSSPRWEVSSSGGLQRSFDGGTTWQDVSVSPNDYKNQKVKMSKKEPVNSGPVFRAVAALSAEVWAGGSSAMLYHSLDSGNNWTRVVPSEASASLSGDIVGMEFSDAQHGRIATSTGEVWLTGDDGQTWHKQ